MRRISSNQLCVLFDWQIGPWGSLELVACIGFVGKRALDAIKHHRLPKGPGGETRARCDARLRTDTSSLQEDVDDGDDYYHDDQQQRENHPGTNGDADETRAW